MTHAEYIDPVLAAKLCTAAELEVVRYRNQNPPMSWTRIVELTGKSRSTVRGSWKNANRKVRGEYVPLRVLESADDEQLPAGYVKPQAGTARAVRATDPDIFKTWQGVPFSGTRGATDGTQPGQTPRSGKD